jgi:hypothetical protein
VTEYILETPGEVFQLPSSSTGKGSKKVLTIDNPTPAIRTPVGIRRPVVYFIGFGLELAGFHAG